jgi:hypothetical protein
MSELRKAAVAVIARWDSPDWKDGTHTADYFNALRAALAEPEQSEPSPFGWVKSSEMETSRRFGGSINLWREKYDCDVPVYLAAPPRREPLTEDKMWELWNAQGDNEMDQAAACAFARAVEQYHGIGGKE